MLKAPITSLLLMAVRLAAQIPAHPSMGPNDYFDIGATNYIFSNDGSARTWIDEGTNRFPADKRLQALARLVPPPQTQPQPQPQNQPKSDENKNKKQPPKNQPDDKQDNQDKKQGEKSEEEKQKQDQQQASQASPQKDKSDEKDQKDAAAYALGQMTPEQAEQLLDAQKGEEQVLQFKPADKPRDRTRPIKDW